MNVLVEVDYLLSIFRKFSTEDNTNSVYLKPLLEQILADMCKSFGNYNVLRLAYNDASNCFYIIDDQLTPGTSIENTAIKSIVNASNTTEIPMIGKSSIVNNVEISTDISSRLSNLIAISANGGSGVDSIDGSMFGASKLLIDRFSSSKKSEAKSTSPSNKKGSSIAYRFNEEIIKIYSEKKPNLEGIISAQNYYIGKLSNIKEKDENTKSSVMIPVSINFSTTGISGLNMYQSFTVSDLLLPSGYNKIERGRHVGFCITSLTHNIEDSWTTSAKGQMIFVSDRTYASIPEIIQSSPNKKTPQIKYSSSGSRSRCFITNTRFKSRISSERDRAKKALESYLGSNRTISDQDFDNLIALIFAESGANPREDAAIAAVVLNRVRFTPNSITEIIHIKNQFEPVTGLNCAGPNANYRIGPNNTREISIYNNIVSNINSVRKDYRLFTSKNECLFYECQRVRGVLTPIIVDGNKIPIKGRNQTFFEQVKKSGEIIGSSIFAP